MLRKNKRAFFLYKKFTLKKRIVLIFTTSITFTFVCTALVSIYAIKSIQTNKIQAGIRSNLNQIRLSIESNISNLSSVSLQLSSMGNVGKEFGRFLISKQPYERSSLLNNMKEEITTISYSNPGVGLMMYYFGDNKTYLLENSGVKAAFSIDKLPLLAAYYGIKYYGPHISNSRFNNQYVLSALIKVDIPSRDDVYAYTETGFKLTQNILAEDQVGVKIFHIMLDNNGRISYSEIPRVFQVNTIFKNGLTNKTFGLEKNFYWFISKSNQGWSVLSVISKYEYNKERNQWIRQMLLLSLVFILALIIVSITIWMMVNKPLNKFNHELDWIEHGNFNTELVPTNIPEFDELLEKFHLMKEQVFVLLSEIKQKEKIKADLEIEKLRYQINPHFLMNTLNSVHWLAVMNNQPEIDGVILTLNKLLKYNLGKKSESATMKEEVEAMIEYLKLQQARYDFNYKIEIPSSESVMKMAMPRFILQPLLENAIYHGLGDDGNIFIKITANEEVIIMIQDDGMGMSEDTIEKLLKDEEPEQGRNGMGIGLNYVKRMIEAYYEGSAGLKINSVLGEGTTIVLNIPFLEENS